ncbi:kinesin-like protein KIN-14U [Contarinia nasturtii]|uniref:kinesin-like protein KIN-14U n=1 Tax=Contarinia nasturtii TaxID=265458 RepID=UPI0012D43665|nr:kinesin-like protein KIN-14U [Contarinia nasturtii]
MLTKELRSFDSKIQNEILDMRKIIGTTHKFVSFNLCSFEEITHESIQFGMNIVKLNVQSGQLKKFYFNHILNGSGEKLECMVPILNAYLSGENACVIVHGETGSGKSTSMYGTVHCPMSNEKGIISVALDYLLGKSHKLHVSFVEYYNGKWADLLSDNVTMEDKPLKECHEYEIKSIEDIQPFLKNVLQKRNTKSTNQNMRSSRSNAVMILSNGKSKMLFVDMAGNENIEDKENIKETCSINKSLSQLNTVLVYKSQRKKHPPYRDDAFTLYLKPYLEKNKAVVFFHVRKENIVKDLLKIHTIVGMKAIENEVSPKKNAYLR